MKRLVKEIICIVILSIIMGFVYNCCSPKSLPLIRVEQKIPEVSDSILMIPQIKNDTNIQKNSDIIKTKIDTVDKNANNSQIKDTNSSNKKNIEKKSKKDILQEIEKNKLSATKPELKTLTYIQIIKHLGDYNFQFVDARKHEDYLKGKIGNAINAYPFDEEKLYFRTLTSLPYDKLLIVYCDGGDCELSHHVCDDLFSFGYKNVYIYSKGWEEWSQKQGIK